MVELAVPAEVDQPGVPQLRQVVADGRLGLAQFVVLLIAMFHKPESVRVAFGGDNRTQTKLGTQSNQVSR